MSPLGESLIRDGLYEGEIRKALGVSEDWPVFVPTKIFDKDGKKVVLTLMEGYCFVGTGLDEVRYFRLENGRLVTKVMSQIINSMRVLHVLQNSKVEEIRQKMAQEIASDFQVGMRVSPTVGPFSGLEGVITLDQGEKAQVHFSFRSRKIWKTFPKVLLTPVTGETHDLF